MRSVFFGASSAQQPNSDYMIPAPLSAEQLRVLGCLIEKQFLTPDIYPLSLNAIVTACNQKTSREPVVSYDERGVEETLASLQSLGLSTRITGADHRVPKYRELLSEKTGLRVSEIALLCVMMLRGPQTVNELKERTNRIHEFADETEVADTLQRLTQREPQILVVRIERQPGFKEPRYMHLLAGPVTAADVVSAISAPQPVRAAPQEDRLVRLETEVAALKDQIAEIQRQFADFRRQFE
jgi:hypothetical protein